MPAEVASDALDYLLFNPEINFASLQAAMAVVLGFVTFSRAGSLVSIMDSDVICNDAQLRVYIRREKTARTRTVIRRIDILDPNPDRDLVVAFQHYQSRRAQMNWSSDVPFLGERTTSPGQWISQLMSSFLQEMEIPVPSGDRWTSRSLRSGGASAAFAMRAQPVRIMYTGGWADWNTVARHYLDLSIRETDDACRLLGGMATH